MKLIQAVGGVGLNTSVERMQLAAAWAGADKVAANLKEGYDTQLTRRFSGGVELSGGEWQKVALARGFMRDAALMILDEPTAALDAEAEYHLFQRFRELIAGKTALIISHRFSTVRIADNILVLEDGVVIESGSHQELMIAIGRYAELYAMQAGIASSHLLPQSVRLQAARPVGPDAAPSATCQWEVQLRLQLFYHYLDFI